MFVCPAKVSIILYFCAEKRKNRRIMNENNSVRRAQLEVCSGTIGSVLAARKGGADRVELCSGLDEGGLTPSLGFIREAVAVEGIRTHVLIRPRGGDFLYTDAERRVILDDIRVACEAGAHGIVVGALTADGDIDELFCREMVEASQGRSLTFHRAFDMCRDARQALEVLVGLGFDRVLTSGQAATAEEGIPMLRELVSQAAGRIRIMAGCGVSPSNARRILDETGATDIHASARTLVESRMRWRREDVAMGRSDADEYTYRETSADIVCQIRREIG